MQDVRNKKGQFLKGFRSNPGTEFKKGEHWRRAQIFRDKQWLINEYLTKGRSTADIAKQFNVTDGAIVFWLRKHEIIRRSVSEARKLKKWGLYGSDNPMWNKRGELNPMWKGGITPERQDFYTSPEWRAACSIVWKRDNATCQRCGLYKEDSKDVPFHIHHKKSFKHEELRADINNLVLVCEICHQFIHSKKNTENEFLQ